MIVNTAVSRDIETQQEIISLQKKLEKMSSNLNQVYKPVLDQVPKLERKLDECVIRSAENMDSVVTNTHNMEALHSKVSAHYTIITGRMYPLEKKIAELDEFCHRRNDYYERIQEGDDRVRKSLESELALLQKKVYRVIFT